MQVIKAHRFILLMQIICELLTKIGIILLTLTTVCLHDHLTQYRFVKSDWLYTMADEI